MKLLLLLAWFAVCADQDARRRTVSNRLTFGAIALAAAYLLINGSTWLDAPPAEAAWALLIALLLTLPGYAMGKLGAGDVKLLIALALATDRLHLLGTFIGAGVATVVWLLVRQKIWSHAGQRVTHRYPNMAPRTSNKLPFVPFLFVGLLLAAFFLH